MRKTLIVTMAAGALSIGLIGAASAQPSADASATAPAAAAPAAAAKLDIDSPIGDLLDHPETKAVLAKHLPKLLDFPQLDMVRPMSLRQVSQYPQAEIDDAKLKAISDDLAAATAAK